VTAAHVLENIPGKEATLSFRRREAEGVYQPVARLIAALAGGNALKCRKG